MGFSFFVIFFYFDDGLFLARFHDVVWWMEVWLCLSFILRGKVLKGSVEVKC